MLENTNWEELFAARHIDLAEAKTAEMLEFVKARTLDELIDETVPKGIRLNEPLEFEYLPEAKSEARYITDLKELAASNRVFKSYIGLGYHPAITPPVIQRNILENPGWYTQYTPYQAEIAQGRLRALLNFQTMIIDLTGMEIANASLLDESTAAAEAMHLLYNVRKNLDARTFCISSAVFPQTIDVLRGFAEPLGIEICICSDESLSAESTNLSSDVFGILLQFPDAGGGVVDHSGFAAHLATKGVGLVVACDLLSLTLLEPPGRWGADVVVGTSQRFGIPLGYGGPHAAFFATKEQYKRYIPGRIIGVSVDAHGNEALRMALQTREQHIKRDKATSNICTAQALLAIMASMYAVWHGPKGIKQIAARIHDFACELNNALLFLGYKLKNSHFFDTVSVFVDEDLINSLKAEALDQGINLCYRKTNVSISIHEVTTYQDIHDLIRLFARLKGVSYDSSAERVNSQAIPTHLKRKSAFLTHPVFNSYHTEHEMLRYIKRLESKDLSLVHSMIALGSCTMKLNATTEMLPVTWPEFASLHPFAPGDQTAGYLRLFNELQSWLCSITGFAAVSLQPNSGAQGEYTGLRVIRAYFKSRNESQRDTVLIPSSAHGTNPASAVIAGFKVVVVSCDDKGNIDLPDLERKAELHSGRLAALMITYPSTHGVFEEHISDCCAVIHRYGGQVYMDGANMNAQVGLTSPEMIGADVCHLNLHKTFCIPHGGGGPGVGPIGVRKHLAPFLPGHFVLNDKGGQAIHAVTSAPWGSAGVLVISHAYISLMGASGLTLATKHAILNANYIKAKLENYYEILYSGKNGRSAHELILDCRVFKRFGIEVVDIAKRLIDYGYHAPTVSFPVSGTMMIEPTESESKEELDRFCSALISVRKEIEEVASGKADRLDNVLKGAPHTAVEISSSDWSHPYSRSKAAYPLTWVQEHKFWPSVGRLNETQGDRVLICSCPAVESYQDADVLEADLSQ